MTFSIVARCPRSGMLGIAISTALPAVGGLCSFAEAGVGAVVTQSWVNPYLGLDGLALLRDGGSAQDVLDRLVADDPGRDGRQVGIVDAQGRSASFTGTACTGWAGQMTGAGYAVQGNMLISAHTLVAMEEQFLASREEHLGERLVRSLEAGQQAGGDKRGRQSAALVVHDTQAYPSVDLRVDEHVDPVAELRRVWAVARRQLLPFVATMPTRENPLGRPDPGVVEMILRPPDQRG